MLFFFFNDTATTEIYTLSLHDALPILQRLLAGLAGADPVGLLDRHDEHLAVADRARPRVLEDRVDHGLRSEEHTSELQSRQYLVCRLLLEKKKTIIYNKLNSPSQYI